MRLIRCLNELQQAHGFLTEEALRELARRERVPLYRLHGLVSFYPHFRTTPPPRVELNLCRDMTCWLAGGPTCAARVRDDLAGLPQTEIHEVSCLGRCDQAPAAALNGKAISLGDGTKIRAWAARPETIPAPEPEPSRSWRCDPYAAGERFG